MHIHISMHVYMDGCIRTCIDVLTVNARAYVCIYVHACVQREIV